VGMLVAAPPSNVGGLRFRVSDLVTSSLRFSQLGCPFTLLPLQQTLLDTYYSLTRLHHQRRKFEGHVLLRSPSPLFLVHCGCSMEGGHSTGKYCCGGLHNCPCSSPLLGIPFWQILKAADITTVVVTIPTSLRFLLLSPSRFFRREVLQW
jgi:hypothetical protein